MLDFFMKQLLGMKWLSDLVENLFAKLGIDVQSRLGASAVFFVYDVIKILILLSFLVYIVTFIQTYFSPERARKIISKVNGVVANTMAALLGTITPFCSCSSIPLFIGFCSAGLPIGVTFSFLISSPMVDLGSLVLLMSVFSPNIAFAYVAMGLLIAILGGHLISKLNMEDELKPFIRNLPTIEVGEDIEENDKINWHDRNTVALTGVISTIKNVFLYILIGVGVGALIHNYIPEEFIHNVLGIDNPFSVLIATFIGIPMYADIFGTIPIAEALYAKGVGVGTILSFMMATTTLSLPSIIMLSKAIKPKLLIVFISIVTLGILVTGYVFNFMMS